MPSTACSCVGHFLDGDWLVDVADPFCRWHGTEVKA